MNDLRRILENDNPETFEHGLFNKHMFYLLDLDVGNTDLSDVEPVNRVLLLSYHSNIDSWKNIVERKNIK